jgi:hypothetical protein
VVTDCKLEGFTIDGHDVAALLRAAERKKTPRTAKKPAARRAKARPGVKKSDKRAGKKPGK